MSSAFRRDGFFESVERFFSPKKRIDALRDSFPQAVRREVRHTGNLFPDEWYWREGMSLPDVTRSHGQCVEKRT